jgi:sulfoxide reductase heme-binding subunit YedZ
MIKNIIKNYGTWILTHIPLLIGLFMLLYLPGSAKTVLVYAGYTAVFFLIFVLVLNPLRAWFPASSVLRVLNRYRREFGVASFSYAFLHMISYLVKKGSIAKFLKFVFHPAIIPVLFVALPLLLALALTSNNSSVKKLGFQEWKKLHRRVYIAEIAIFLHMILVGEAFYAFLIFIPLFILQSKRKDLIKSQ